jgi:hypothetical protein
LIGVIAEHSQIGVVDEFFELFKTPWEPYRPGREYEVVISASDREPTIKPKLLLIYNSSALSLDRKFGFVALEHCRGGELKYRNAVIPIFGSLVTFTSSHDNLLSVEGHTGAAGAAFRTADSTVIRLGYDLFEEIRLLLSGCQPLVYAHIPTLTHHIEVLRELILDTGIPVLEIPPSPSGHSFIVCLTHDIDFIGIRNHKFDRTMWGFVYRAGIRSLFYLLRGKTSWAQLWRNWCALASLPFVYAGLAKDFWSPFEWYLEVERGLPGTYFIIPFKKRAGENVPGPRASLRATAYDITDIPSWVSVLLSKGCEVGVHGIDAWHSSERGHEEWAQVSDVSGVTELGIRTHWLLQGTNTASLLDKAGFIYDSTVGYNDTIGYRAGTNQVFRPFEVQSLLELPLLIQDGALFFPQRLNLPEVEAEERCFKMINQSMKNGGVLTVLWHDRSHGPERFWGNFYVKLVQSLQATNAWFATGLEAVKWFKARRNVRFETAPSTRLGVLLHSEGVEIKPPLNIRLYNPTPRKSRIAGEHEPSFVEFAWDGKSAEQCEAKMVSALSSVSSENVLCP